LDAVSDILIHRRGLEIYNHYQQRGYDLRRTRRVKTYNKSEKPKICCHTTAHEDIVPQGSSQVKKSSDTEAGRHNTTPTTKIVVWSINRKDQEAF